MELEGKPIVSPIFNLSHNFKICFGKFGNYSELQEEAQR